MVQRLQRLHTVDSAKNAEASLEAKEKLVFYCVMAERHRRAALYCAERILGWASTIVGLREEGTEGVVRSHVSHHRHHHHQYLNLKFLILQTRAIFISYFDFSRFPSCHFLCVPVLGGRSVFRWRFVLHTTTHHLHRRFVLLRKHFQPLIAAGH